MSKLTPRARAVLAAALLAVAAGAIPSAGSTRAAAAASPALPGNGFEVGAAVADFTPPAFGHLTDAQGRPVADPADCVHGTVLETVFTGPRPFAFEEPYVDEHGSGHYDADDPFVDCNHDGRWDGNFIGGGSDAPRFYDRVADPVEARAMVVSNGSSTFAVEVLDQEGVFNVYQRRIRQQVAADLPGALDNVFISATHDESAPDTLGLYGASLSAAGQQAPTSLSSSVNPYFVDYMVRRSADAVEAAWHARQPATIRYAEAHEPDDLRQCWSSYPFVDDGAMPTLQALDAGGHAIATLVSVSQHAETLGFNSSSVENPQGTETANQKDWLTGDLPHFVRDRIEQHYGGVGIAMAGSVGSVETPQIFNEVISRTPQQFVDASHPAGCRTLFTADLGTEVPLGYFEEDVALGNALGDAVASALDTSAMPALTNAMWGERADVCVPVTNALFLAAGAIGIFADRPGYVANCTAHVPALPDGTTAADEILSDVAAFRIGDATFLSLPGEVFPFTYLRGFQGPQDMPYPQFPMPPWLMAHLDTPYRFIDGLAEDMIGYIFPQGNGVGVPGEHPVHNTAASGTDRFGCGHSDDSESANSQAADIIAQGELGILARHGSVAEDIELGRYVLPDGSLSRDPLGSAGGAAVATNGTEVKCSLNTTFVAAGPAVRVRLAGGEVVTPAAWMSLSGRPQTVPDRDTRGWISADGVRHWLDVFPDRGGA